MVASWDRRSEREQRRVRDLTLSTWLPEVATASTYWRDRTEQLGLEPGDLSDSEDLGRFAPIRELDVLGAGPGGAGLVVRPTEDEVKALAPGSFLRRVARAIRRGGAEARRLAILEEYKPIHLHDAGSAGGLVVAYSRSDLDRLHRAGARAAAVLGLDDADYLVSLIPPGALIEWWGIYHLALGTSMLAVHPRYEWAQTGPQEALRRVPATVVAVTAHEAVSMAATLVEGGADLARVHTVVVVGPPPPAAERRRIADAWQAAGALTDVRVRAAWAPAEGRALWVECAAGGEGLHTYGDLDHVELVDAVTGEPTEADGDLTYTSLGWRGTALLRYQTGAYVESIDTSPCPSCERTVPRLVGEVAPAAWHVEATTLDVPWFIDLRGAGAVLNRQPGIDTWRVEVRPEDVMAAEVSGSLSDSDRQRTEDRLAAATGAQSAVIEVVEDPVLVERHAEELGSVFADVR
ncbi:MAG: hypothetical protein R3343_02700 [Nitriliruptorales bacterium]|nr:hypothetical protein [Nitriliruptorales bacterium]